ncbi:MAG: MBL fold metallo-hydrolase [Clostridia bacterium]|nr:MBL fold metallo-hydrolase [Clostridia bacterium]
MDFVKRFTEAAPGQKQIALFWLGQAGFLIKTPSGRSIAIDPYFSDCVMHMFPEEGLGFKRLSPPPCAADDIRFDALLISHEHGDHFDQESIGPMMANGITKLYTNCTTGDLLRAKSFDMARVEILKKGETVALPDCTLLPVDCDHGELAPEALGFILDFGFLKLYYAGDTALTPQRLAVPLAMKPDVAILPINGAFGNLDGEQAARYAGMLGAKVCVPCHFWTFPLHRGDPQQIIEAIGGYAPECELKLLCQGEGVLLGE